MWYTSNTNIWNYHLALLAGKVSYCHVSLHLLSKSFTYSRLFYNDLLWLFDFQKNSMNIYNMIKQNYLETLTSCKNLSKTILQIFLHTFHQFYPAKKWFFHPQEKNSKSSSSRQTQVPPHDCPIPSWVPDSPEISTTPTPSNNAVHPWRVILLMVQKSCKPPGIYKTL